MTETAVFFASAFSYSLRHSLRIRPLFRPIHLSRRSSSAPARSRIRISSQVAACSGSSWRRCRRRENHHGRSPPPRVPDARAGRSDPGRLPANLTFQCSASSSSRILDAPECRTDGERDGSPASEREAPELRRMRPNPETEATAMRIVMEYERSSGRQVSTFMSRTSATM